MKNKSIIFIIAFFSCYLPASSQNNKLFIGAGAGIAVTNLKFEDSLNLFNTALRGHVGIYCDYSVSNKIYLGIGLNYRSKQVRTENISFTDMLGNIISDRKYYYTFNYITVPVLINYYFGDKIKFKFGLGGYYGILLKSSIDVPVPVEGQNGPVDITAQTSKSDMGITARAGLLIPLNKRLYFNFDLVDEIGLSPIDFSQGTNLYTNELRTRSFSGSAGLSFSF